jgi:hypothetical protein
MRKTSGWLVVLCSLYSVLYSLYSINRGGVAFKEAMKRETGENPVQSRCCMFFCRKMKYAIKMQGGDKKIKLDCFIITLHLEKAHFTRTSQKTCPSVS